MYKIEVKSTITNATIKLIALQLIFAAIYLTTSLISDSVDQFNNGTFVNTIAYDSLSFIIIAFVQLTITLYIFLEWATDTYILFPDKIEHRRGIILKKIDSWLINNIWTAHITQGLMGRMFDYGTISFHSPTLENHIVLKNIPSPSLVIAAVEKNLTLSRKNEINLMSSQNT